jgi:hypothetical protein
MVTTILTATIGGRATTAFLDVWETSTALNHAPHRARNKNEYHEDVDQTVHEGPEKEMQSILIITFRRRIGFLSASQRKCHFKRFPMVTNENVESRKVSLGGTGSSLILGIAGVDKTIR